MKRFAVVVVASMLVAAGHAGAKTLMLEGRLDSSIAMRQQMEFSVDQGPVQTFTFRFALPADFHNKTVNQNVDAFSARITPQPSSSTIEQDRFGNRFQKVSWNNVSDTIRISLGYTANVRSELSAMESRTPFPIGAVGAGESLYLKPTELVQSDAGEIADLARRLTAGAGTEYEAVTAVTNYVTDAIKYTFNPPQYDARYTLSTKSGNCQNFAHLSIALLRSVGIPARIVGGITLKDTWKVPVDNRSSIVQSMGQGGHAWMEIYFPDLGWLSYDPQQSRQFTSTRHIKQTHGLDSRDINDTWRGAPYLPRYSELIEGSFKADDVQLKVKNTGKDPRPYIISNMISARATAVAPDPSPPRAKPGAESPARPTAKPPVAAEPKPPVAAEPKPPVAAEPKPPVMAGGGAADEMPSGDGEGEGEAPKPIRKPSKPATKPLKPPAKEPQPPVKPPVRESKPPVVQSVVQKPKKPVPGSQVVLGNMEFPALVNAYSVQGNVGTRILEKETSEYVTSQHIFAQAFHLKDALALSKVSLAMRKFGGDGSVYVDLVQDDGSGRPNILAGVRSDLVALEKIARKPGYYWVDFSFPRDSLSRLKPGKYWIVCRYSGEAIMNWFYIPGKPYSDSDDTRSTAKGFQWEDILNYDFVFKVTGTAL